MQDLSWFGCLVAVALIPVAVYSVLLYRKFLRLQEDSAAAAGTAKGQLAQLQTELSQLQSDNARLQNEKASLEHYQSSLMEDLTCLKEENQGLRTEIDSRPTQTDVRYGIATIGISGSGKTALTLPWASPLVRLKHIGGTQFDKYERTVSRVYDKDSRVYVQHIFEIYDWGGEHIDEAQTALVKLGAIHALVLVVDLGPFVASEGKHVFSKERIAAQLEKFNTHALTYFFATSIVQHCKHYVLFINKSDLLSGFPAEVEAQARGYFRPLIDDLTRWAEERGVNFEVIVGSADTGAGTRLLIPYLIENILPEEAYDDQLKKRPSGAAPMSVPQTAATGAAASRDASQGRVEHLRPAMRG